jgi:dTDP-glucose 4,6-dehydratase
LDLEPAKDADYNAFDRQERDSQGSYTSRRAADTTKGPVLITRTEPNSILITGGAGFIGSNFARYCLSSFPNVEVRVLDKLTYAGTRDSLKDVEGDRRFSFVHGDICDPEVVARCVVGCDAIVNFAAETHVDRSLLEPSGFIQTNVHGTWVMLEAALRQGVGRFVQVSTDEVYGEVLTGESIETDRLHPRNPYSASKAGAEMMVIAYAETHGLDAGITRGSNTYGPYQFPEKFIPLMITNALAGEILPVYGDGMQRRHWIHVWDHCSGIDAVLRRGEPGAVYNVGSDDERANIEVAQGILELVGQPQDLIRHVTDRPGHDRRYALSSQRLRSLGWSPSRPFQEGLAETVRWYVDNRNWWEPLKDRRFAEYYGRNYGHRASHPASRDGT